MFEKIFRENCFSPNPAVKFIAKNLLEKLYCCEINCIEIAPTVKFAHHGRGCTIIASKICENVIIYQNVTIGANLRYDKTLQQWKDIGNPIISKNVIIADGAKIFGAIVIGENTLVAPSAIVTIDIPADSIAYGVNKYKPKDPNMDYLFNENMPSHFEMIEANKKLIGRFLKQA